MEPIPSGLSEKEWKKQRKLVITATEAACIIGLNPWRSAAMMWKEKTKGSDFVPNSYVVIGQMLEPIVVKCANLALNRNFRLYEEDDKKVFFVRDDLRLGATPDAHDGKELLECKTTKPHNLLKWAYTPPLYYLFQLHIQLLCTDLEVGYLAVMGTNLEQKTADLTLPLLVFEVHRNAKLENFFLEQLADFWKKVDQGKLVRVPSSVKHQAQLLTRLTYRKIR